MKKTTLVLTLVLVIALLAGCAGTPVIYYTNCTCPTGAHVGTTPTETDPIEPIPATTVPTESVPVAEGAVKTGVAILANAADSKGAGDADGEAKYDVTIVAVTVDDNGVIQDCIIDSIGTSVMFDVRGNIVSDLTAPILTKNELGEDYGMKAYAGSQYEWNEQAANFAAYVTGKTAADVALIHVDEATKPTDADLATSVTIAIGGFQNLIAKAVQ